MGFSFQIFQAGRCVAQASSDPDPNDAQGLIFFETTFGARTVFGHDGDDPGTSSQMFFDPATKTGVLLVAKGEWDEDAAEALMTKLFDEAAK